VAEYLRFHQLTRDRTAVQCKKGSAASWAFPVNRLGAQFLTGSRFAGDEDTGFGDRGGGDGAVNSLHRCGITDEVAVTALDRFRDRFNDRREFRPLDRVLKRHRQPLRRERLHKEVVGAKPHRFDRPIDGAMGGDCDHRRASPFGLQTAQHLESIDPRQLNVEHDEVGVYIR